MRPISEAPSLSLTYIVDSILGQYGKEMTWDMKAGCMGKRVYH